MPGIDSRRKRREAIRLSADIETRRRMTDPWLRYSGIPQAMSPATTLGPVNRIDGCRGQRITTTILIESCARKRRDFSKRPYAIMPQSQAQAIETIETRLIEVMGQLANGDPAGVPGSCDSWLAMRRWSDVQLRGLGYLPPP